MEDTAKRLAIYNFGLFVGPGPSAFHFKEPYGPDGEKVILDRDRIRRLSEVNAGRHADLMAAVRGMTM